MPKENITTLNSKYIESDSIDRGLFSEQRSNIRLTTGDHYVRETTKHLNRLRSTTQTDSEIKLRLTKNHISKIIKTYINNILNQAPGVQIIPNNDSEMQDQKAAELHSSVWDHIKKNHKFSEKLMRFAKDFIEIGEIFVKLSWDAEKGDPIPGEIEQEIDQETGEVIGQTQQMIVPGDLTFERIYGFNVLRDASAKEMEEARFLIIRKMVEKSELLARFEEDDPRREYIHESGKDTYRVYNGASNRYSQNATKVMLREFYFRPSKLYPQGYYYISTEAGILFEGPLPLGIFPIVHIGFDEVATSPRSRSIIKQLRPYQAEINRAASKIAEHQVTLGDDKVFIQRGTKLSRAGTTSGVRGVQYSGAAPVIQPGRNGAQYLDYMNSQIAEMYQVANIIEDSMEKGGPQDAYAMLFRSMKDKKKFSFYSEKFERFIIEICETSLKLYKNYCIPQAIIPAIGKREAVNIPEFKNSEDLGFQISIKPRTDDMESMMGKILTANHVLQFASAQLPPESIGQIVRNMPFANKEEMLTDLTIDYDIAKNTMLALDRGEEVPTQQYDNFVYLIKRITHRIRQPDFAQLDPGIQQLYQIKIQELEQAEAERQQVLQRANSGYIPTGGALIGVDLYIEVPSSSGGVKTQRARVPSEAIQWLLSKIEDQGSSQEELDKLTEGSQAQIAQDMLDPSDGFEN